MRLEKVTVVWTKVTIELKANKLISKLLVNDIQFFEAPIPNEAIHFSNLVGYYCHID